MINVHSRGQHFQWLVAYLLRNGQDAEGLDWTATRNLPTEDPTLAAVFMQATAAHSPFVQKPVYQIVLSFAPEDPVDRVMMERVADRVLARLGLGDHEALLVAHRDRPHAHLHIVVNRVHPETGRVWALWQDWRRVREVLAAEERALGLRPASAGLVLVDQVALDLRAYERVLALGHAHARAEQEASAAHARQRQWDGAAEQARTAWTHAARALGRVYGDPAAAYAAYAAAARLEGVPHATRRLREQPETFGALRGLARTRLLGLRHTRDLAPARAAAGAAAAAAQATFAAARAWQDAVATTAHALDRAFDRELDALYQAPAAARRAFERLAAEQGLTEAAAALRARPATLGVLRTSPGDDARPVADQAARAAACGRAAAQARALATQPAGLDAGPPVNDPAAVGRGEAERAAAHAAALRAAQGSLPRRSELERRLRTALDYLAPRQLRRLRQLVTAPQFALAMQLRRVLREIAVGQDGTPDD